jgi:4a-hydroxytetrahydrobiopterin dehydratase
MKLHFGRPMALKDEKCLPCEGGTPPLGEERIRKLLHEVPGWTVREGKLRKDLKFADFVSAMSFLNRLAEIAEREGHHPDFCVHYNRVELTVWTHAIGGLSQNDFILASKIDALL